MSAAEAAPDATGAAQEVPPELIPHVPPEWLGRTRDDVRLLVSDVAEGTDTLVPFARGLPGALAAGDLLVVNDSATVPAALDVADGLRVHWSGSLPGGLWVVELRRAVGIGSGAFRGDHRGRSLVLPGGVRLTLLAPFPAGHAAADARLWVAAPQPAPGDVIAYLAATGAPVRYGPDAVDVPLDAYQTVFARVPGSAEMPSAARPLSHRVLTALAGRDVRVATLTLHTGVSSTELGEPPPPEWFAVTEETAAAVRATRGGGGRVVAVGTSVVRALESAAGRRDEVTATAGWTEHVVTPETGAATVDGLLTGWHEPGASHLALLAALAGADALDRAYRAAHAHRLRWHEFGDSHLLLTR